MNQQEPNHVAIIRAAWHADLLDRFETSIQTKLASEQVELSTFVVPGAFEIPLLAQKLATTGTYDAIIALALVVNGGIYEHRFVGSAVLDGLMNVQLQTQVPVLSGVLTPLNFHENDDHNRFFSEHLQHKGNELADSTLAILQLHQQHQSPS